MRKLLGLNLMLYVDSSGKLRVRTKIVGSELFAVEGFKIKVSKDKNYVFPILKVEISKK